MKYNERGEELPDDTPVEAPVKFRRPPSIQELIAMHVKAAMQVERKMGKEDDDDFEDDDDADDVLTPYEIDAYAGEANMEIRKAEATQKVLDKLVKKKDSKNTVDSDRIKEDGNVRLSEREDADRVRERSGVRGDPEEVFRRDEGGRLEAGGGKDGPGLKDRK